MAFSMMVPLATRMSFSERAAASGSTGKYIRPSRSTHPRCWANSITAPSDSRNNRFLALEIGSEGYAFSEQSAISLRMVPTRTYSPEKQHISTSLSRMAADLQHFNSHSRTKQSPPKALAPSSSPATPYRSYPPSNFSPAPRGI